MNEWLQLLAGGVFLYLGAEWFVRGSSSLALALRVPQLIIGLTIVAYGTSAPEIIVGIEAARAGHGEIALGNVVGSNIANIGLILGIAILLKPPRVDATFQRRERLMLLASGVVLPLLLLNGRVSRLEAVGLLMVAVGYSAWMVRASRVAASDARATEGATTPHDAAESAGAPRAPSRLRAGATAVVGLAVLLLGGNLFVDGAASVALRLGVSDRLVGLTLVAVGTSLPELVTSVIAAARGHSDLALGNVVGSNIFNTFLCLGAAALVGAVGAPLRESALELGTVVVMTLFAWFVMRRPRTLTRVEGFLMLTMYVGFTVAVVVKG